jgi:AcrR family transcriptional regulator
LDVIPQPQMSPARKRSDAQKNRDRILDAARSALAEDAEASLAEISRRAGVGMATLYRNFPGRKELLETVYASEVVAVCEAAADAAGSATPGLALRAWLRRCFAFAATKKHIASQLLAHENRDSTRTTVFHGSRERVLTAGRPLFEAAQRAHQVRDDLTLEQVLDMLVTIASSNGSDAYQAPMLETVLDGLALPSDKGSQTA